MSSTNTKNGRTNGYCAGAKARPPVARSMLYGAFEALLGNAAKENRMGYRKSSGVSFDGAFWERRLVLWMKAAEDKQLPFFDEGGRPLGLTEAGVCQLEGISRETTTLKHTMLLQPELASSGARRHRQPHAAADIQATTSWVVVAYFKTPKPSDRADTICGCVTDKARIQELLDDYRREHPVKKRPELPRVCMKPPPSMLMQAAEQQQQQHQQDGQKAGLPRMGPRSAMLMAHTVVNPQACHQERLEEYRRRRHDKKREKPLAECGSPPIISAAGDPVLMLTGEPPAKRACWGGGNNDASASTSTSNEYYYYDGDGDGDDCGRFRSWPCAAAPATISSSPFEHKTAPAYGTNDNGADGTAVDEGVVPLWLDDEFEHMLRQTEPLSPLQPLVLDDEVVVLPPFSPPPLPPLPTMPPETPPGSPLLP